MSSIEWTMMIAFILALGLSLWKLYAFLPNEPLPDDDTTEEALDKLTAVMVKAVVELGAHEQELNLQTLYVAMKAHSDFDHEHFWRFNENKLNNLIVRYFLKHPHASTLEHIYEYESGIITQSN
ncbi:MAG: hypothetical protein R3302_08585 [Sulfurimonadaceae bacterium]|nr:hypothetical protein [Sulfurimonadaceae bacterium]